jgi:OOP family OmpA-OmpF porin
MITKKRLLQRASAKVALIIALCAAPDASRAQETRQTFTLQGNQLVLPGPVVFETGSDKLKPESDAVLKHVQEYLAQKTYISLMRIEAHTDSDGNAAANQTLTEKRALAVARRLVAGGVDCKRLLPVGFGQTKPIAANDSVENKAQNRRVAFVNAALRGRPIGGMPVDGGGKVAGDPCTK